MSDCAGHYRLNGDINLPPNFRSPLCNNQSHPFSGSLDGQGHVVRGLNISRPGANAGLFGYMDGAKVNIHMENPSVYGRTAAALVAQLLSDNDIDITCSGGNITGEDAAGFVAGNVTGDRNHIRQKGGTKETITITGLSSHADAGGGFGRINHGVDNTLNQFKMFLRLLAGDDAGASAGEAIDVYRATFTQHNVRADVSAGLASKHGDGGGVFGYLGDSDDVTVDQKNGQVIIRTARNAGGVLGLGNNLERLQMTQTDMNITARAVDDAGGGGGQQIVSRNVALNQKGGEMVIEAEGQDPSIGFGGGGFGATHDVSNMTVSQTGIKMRVAAENHPGEVVGGLLNSQQADFSLYSGDPGAQLPVVGYTHPGVNPNNTVPPTGLIDVAGYPSGSVLPGSNMTRLNTTVPNDWRIAQEAYCGAYANATGKTSGCHYPYEQLHTLVPAGNDTLLLATHQRYPFNPDSDENSLVRISRLTRNGTQWFEDDTFGSNGTLLYSPASQELARLPISTIPVGHVANQTSLTTLYPADGHNGSGVVLVRFPLAEATAGGTIGNGHSYYETAYLPTLPGQPVFVTEESEPDHAGVWMRNLNGAADEDEDIVQYYQVSLSSGNTTLTSEINIRNTDYPDTPVIGLGANQDYLYVARQVNSDIVLERFDRNDTTLDYQNITLKHVPGLPSGPESNLVYNLQITGNNIVFVPKQSTVFGAATPQALSVKIPRHGGLAEWVYGDIYYVSDDFEHDDIRPSHTLRLTSYTPTSNSQMTTQARYTQTTKRAGVFSSRSMPLPSSSGQTPARTI